MADKKIRLVEIEFNYDKAVQGIAKLSKSIEDLKTEQKEVAKEQGKSSQAYQANAVKLKQLTTEYRVQQKVIVDYNNQLKDEVKFIEKTDGSIKQLEAALRRNKEQYRRLTKEQRENVNVGGKLLSVIDKQDKEYKDLQVSIGTTQVNVGNYQDAVEKALQSQGAFGNVIGNSITQINTLKVTLIAMRNTFNVTKGSVGGTSKALRIFRAALISTGVGALIVALGSLVALLTKTQGGLDFVRKAMKALEAIFDKFTDISIALGKSLVKAFKDPRQALSDLGAAVKKNLLNRLESVGLVITALGKGFRALASRDMKALKDATKELGTAFAQATTGLDAEQQKKIANGIKAVGKEIANETKAAFKLEEQLISLERQEANLQVQRAKSRAEIKRLNKIAEDTVKSSEEREKAAKRAIGIEQGLVAQQIKIQKQRVSIYKQQNALSTSVEEDTQRVRDAEIELYGTQQESLELQTTLNNKLNTIRAQQSAEDQKDLAAKQKIADEKAKLLADEAQARADLVQEVSDRNQTELDKLKEKYLEELKIIGESGTDREKLTKEQQDALIILEENYLAERKDLIDTAREKELKDRLEDEAEDFRRQQAILKIKLNEQLLALGDNEEEKKKLVAQSRLEELEAQKAFLDNQLQLIQAQLAQALTASAAVSMIGIILDDEDKQRLEDNLLEIQAKISELVLKMQDAKAEISGDDEDASWLQKILGVDDEGMENIERGIAITTEAMKRTLDIASGATEARLQKQINQLDRLRSADLISQKEYDKRRQALEKEAFERQKKIQIALATINYLTGIVSIASTIGKTTGNAIIDAVIAAVQIAFLTATFGVQLSKIKSQKYAEGGMIKGNSHARGGVNIEAEGGEFIVKKRKVTRETLPVLEAINDSTLSSIGKRRQKIGIYADGGVVGSSLSRSASSAATGSLVRAVIDSEEFSEVVVAAVAALPAPELNIVDFNEENDRQTSIKDLTQF